MNTHQTPRAQLARQIRQARWLIKTADRHIAAAQACGSPRKLEVVQESIARAYALLVARRLTNNP